MLAHSQRRVVAVHNTAPRLPVALHAEKSGLDSGPLSAPCTPPRSWGTTAAAKCCPRVAVVTAGRSSSGSAGHWLQWQLERCPFKFNLKLPVAVAVKKLRESSGERHGVPPCSSIVGKSDLIT